MSTASNMPAHDVKRTLNALWERLRELSLLCDQVQRPRLDKADTKELESIERITSGYAHFLLESTGRLDAGEVLEQELVEKFATLIDAHCDDCTAAVNYVIAQQAGKPPKSVRVA